MCKYNKDGICVNADCPYVADYCPVFEDETICIHNPINGKKLKKLKKTKNPVKTVDK